MKNDGGPAFPIPGGPNGLAGEEFLYIEPRPGMSLRDYFAAAVVGQLAVCAADDSPAPVAKRAYEIADALIAEREKGQGDES